ALHARVVEDVEVARVHLGDRRERPERLRVVDQPVDATEAFDGLRNHRVDLVTLPYVAHDAEVLDAEVVELAARLRHQVVLPLRDHDARAALPEVHGHALADTLAGSCDDDRLAADGVHVDRARSCHEQEPNHSATSSGPPSRTAHRSKPGPAHLRLDRLRAPALHRAPHAARSPGLRICAWIGYELRPSIAHRVSLEARACASAPGSAPPTWERSRVESSSSAAAAAASAARPRRARPARVRPSPSSTSTPRTPRRPPRGSAGPAAGRRPTRVTSATTPRSRPPSARRRRS